MHEIAALSCYFLIMQKVKKILGMTKTIQNVVFQSVIETIWVVMLIFFTHVLSQLDSYKSFSLRAKANLWLFRNLLRTIRQKSGLTRFVFSPKIPGEDNHYVIHVCIADFIFIPVRIKPGISLNRVCPARRFFNPMKDNFLLFLLILNEYLQQAVKIAFAASKVNRGY